MQSKPEASIKTYSRNTFDSNQLKEEINCSKRRRRKGNKLQAI